MKRRVLIADDEESFLLAIRKILEKDDVVVDTAQCREEACSLLRVENAYSTVVVDLRLGTSSIQDGLGVIKETRKSFPECKIIVYSAYADSNIRELAIGAGGDLFLEKPCPVSELKTHLVS